MQVLVKPSPFADRSRGTTADAYEMAACFGRTHDAPNLVIPIDGREVTLEGLLKWSVGRKIGTTRINRVEKITRVVEGIVFVSRIGA